MKQCQENPWKAFADAHKVGDVIDGEIRNITEFGLFMALNEEIDGMIHMSDLSWEKAGEEAIKDYKKGQVIQAKVLDIDVEKERVSLGVKQLSEDPFAGAAADIKKGEVVTAVITGIEENGITVEVNGVKGYIKKADLAKERSEQKPDRFAVGEKVDAKVTTFDAKNHKLTLSIKAKEADEEKAAMAEFGSADSGASLGDILGAALKRAKKAKGEAEEEDEKPAKAKKTTKKKKADEEVAEEATEETAE
jgi:small subunit ribosomal protein S1